MYGGGYIYASAQWELYTQKKKKLIVQFSSLKLPPDLFPLCLARRPCPPNLPTDVGPICAVLLDCVKEACHVERRPSLPGATPGGLAPQRRRSLALGDLTGTARGRRGALTLSRVGLWCGVRVRVQRIGIVLVGLRFHLDMAFVLVGGAEVVFSEDSVVNHIALRLL